MSCVETNNTTFAPHSVLCSVLADPPPRKDVQMLVHDAQPKRFPTAAKMRSFKILTKDHGPRDDYSANSIAVQH